MPPKKRQKTEPSGNGTTLLAFFSNQAANGSSSTNSSTKSKPPAKTTSKKSSFADEDVIVISDDDEPEKPAVLVVTNKPKKSETPQVPYPLEYEYGVAGPSKLPAWAATRESAEPAPLVESPAPMMMKRELGSSASSFLDVDDLEETGPSPSRSFIMDADPPDPPRGCTPPPPILDTPSKQPTSIVPDPDVIDVDALDDDDNVWRNDDDEFQADETEYAVEDDDDEVDEPTVDVKGKGKCLGEIVLDDAELNAACPICEISTRGWSQEVRTHHDNLFIAADVDLMRRL